MYRLLRLVGLVAVLIGSLALSASPATAQTATCADYSTTAAAQFALEINPGLAPSLDPDGNGVACDHEGASGAQAPSSSTLQLPTESSVTPTPTGQQPPGTVDVIDQQPTTDTTTEAGSSVLTGRLGDSQASFASVHGAPLEVVPSDSNPSLALRAYEPAATVFDLVTIDWNDQVFIIVVEAETSWDGTEAAGIMGNYLPADVTSLPEPEVLSDGSLLMPVFSNDLSTGITAETMSQALIPGVPGDMYVLLVTNETNRIVEFELGVGNGDDVREGADSSSTDPTQTTPPTPTPATTTSTEDATTFLQETRAEVDRLQGQIDELHAIISAGTYTEAEIERFSEIIVGWMAIDTTLPSAPPEHSALAAEVQQVRDNLATVGSTLFVSITSNDTSGIQSAADLLNTVEMNLASIDQQLTALGF